MVGTVEVRRAADRGVLPGVPGVDSRHSFSFGAQLEPGNTHHGVLLAHHEDRIAPGAGYDDHPHRDTEIVTWVLGGTLVHADDAGRTAHVTPGSVQRLSAGRGVVHRERNAADDELHLVQSWLLPDESGVEPVHEVVDVSAHLHDGGWVPVAGPADRSVGVGLGIADAVLHAARPPAGRELALPAGRYLHVFVARGRVGLSGSDLSAGDTARVVEPTASGLHAHTDAEVLVWAMGSDLRGETDR
ncbi:pirin family protein [Actinomycetospora sp. NBRC 106378]|uniref:pirin family protein n=1 Tax=Actinomycetospora sp. NBRC 106378 TaxID=3032208 RepID=UPI0024A3FEF7|nr:pirin family protein [Actinomycetospora sp. NBRC 106378]GLZ50409.1 putative quercetin 2,3-dioxygenase [Actinomycetospora sp. NBRC 106378]